MEGVDWRDIPVKYKTESSAVEWIQDLPADFASSPM